MTIGKQWQKNILIRSKEDISLFSQALKNIFFLFDRCLEFFGPNGKSDVQASNSTRGTGKHFNNRFKIMN